MKLYIPEIGDEITLKSDWTFELHAESRNQDLALFNNHYIHHYRGYNWIDASTLPPMRDPDYELQYPDYDKVHNDWKKVFPLGRASFKDHYDRLCEETRENNKEYQQYEKDRAEYLETAQTVIKKSINVTIPAGTVLKVDRIYIRKGNSEYSSITFYAKDLGEITRRPSYWNRSGKPTKKKSLRFWAKLSDCNNIEI